MTFRRGVLTALAALVLAALMGQIFTHNSDFGSAAIIFAFAFAVAALVVDE